MPANSQRFATVVLTAFVERGLRSDSQVAAAGGPSSTTMTNLRKARDEGHGLRDPRNDTLARIDTAAGWRPGSAHAVWSGQEPASADQDTSIARPDDLEHRVALVEEKVAVLARLIDSRTEEEHEWMIEHAAELKDRIEAELAVLGIELDQYARDYGFDFERARAAVEANRFRPVAARTVRRGDRGAGHQVREAQDAAGQEQQDDGGMDPL